MSEHVLVIDDDADLIRFVRMSLAREGYEVTSALEGTEGLRLALERPPDLILLDVLMPDLDGLELLGRLRVNPGTTSVPVVLLTARADESDAVTALALGADDYVRKPFGLSELIARIGAILRRVQATAQPATELARLGDWQLDLTNFRARGPNGELSLTSIEAELLSVLLESPGEVHKREDLLDRVWGLGAGVLTRTLDNHVARLRKKLEDDPSHPRLILTVHGVGYKTRLPGLSGESAG